MPKQNESLKIVIQQSQILDCVNVSFLTDHTYPYEDCLVTGGDWTNSLVSVGQATLIAEPTHIEALTSRVFRAESNCYSPLGQSLSEEEVNNYLHVLDWLKDSPGSGLNPIVRQIIGIGRNRHKREFRSRSKADDEPIIG